MLSESPLPTSNQEEHARLLKALRESELLRDLSELLASSLDLTQILQVVVRRATEVCAVKRCAVWLLDEAQARLLPSAYHLSTKNVKRKFIQVADRMWHHSALPSDDPIFHQLLQANGVLALEDLHSVQSMRMIAEKLLVHSVLLVALVREGRPVGMMSLDNIGGNTVFSSEQEQLARSIGQQAAIAISNAHLYEQAQVERKRAERLIERAQATYQVALAVNSGDELTQVLEIAAQQLVCGLEVPSAAIALLEKDNLHLVSLVPTSALSIDNYPHPNLQALPQCLAATKKGAPHFVGREQMTGSEKIWFAHLGIENVLIVPLLIGSPHKKEAQSNKKLTPQTSRHAGFAFINYPQFQRNPGSGHYAFVQDIAAQCALAIEKADILAKTQQAVELATERANTLDAVFNAMTEGIIVLDTEGKVILSNNTAHLFIGLTRNAKKQLTTYLQGHPAYTISGQPIPREDFPLVRALHGEHIRGERFMSRHNDGSEHSTEVNTAPVLDAANRQVGIVSAFRDVTEPVRVERRIRLALDTMLHAAEAISGLTDIQEILYRVLDMTGNALNTERGVVQLYDQDKGSFTPLLSIGFTAQEEAAWFREQKSWLIPDEKHRSSQYNQLMDGHTILVNTECIDSLQQAQVLAAPIMHNKRLLGLMMFDRTNIQNADAEASATQVPITPLLAERLEFTAWDITMVEGIAQFAGLAIEQARWQQEAEIARINEASMRESNDLKDEFLAITAHEFRTPLTVILAHSQMMARLLHKAVDVTPGLKNRLYESIAILEEQTRQLTNIVNTFLEVTRLNRGQMSLTKEEVNLDDIIKETLANYKATSTIHEISYRQEHYERPYLLMGDRARLLQIFANLLQNSIKYSPLGGPITITLRQYVHEDKKALIEVCIADRGIGISREAQVHLFERFYRAPSIVSNQTRGVGLGLYVVAEFLRLHDGHIRVESSGVEGEGSQFIFTLPLL